MARQFLTPIDLAGNELRNASLQTVGALPDATARKFQLVGFNNDLYWSDGTQWINVRQAPPGSAEPTGAAGGDLAGTYPNPTLASAKDAELKDRTNHTGTQTAATISDFDAAVQVNRLDQLAAPIAPISVVDPTQPAHAANRGYVDGAVAGLVDTAPETLDTLNELAAALGDDPNFATTVSTQIGTLDTRVDTLEATAIRKYAGTVPGGAVSATITHNLGTRDVQVSVYEVGAPYGQVEVGVEATDVNSVTLRAATAIPANTYRVVVIG